MIRLVRPYRLAIPVAFSLLWVFSLGVISQGLWLLIESPWERATANSARSADAIVVLSGGGIGTIGKDQVVEWNDPDRFLAGVDLYRAGKAPLLLFTGGVNPLKADSSTEGQLYLREAINLGVPQKAIKVTSRVVNTKEEAIKINQLVREKKASKNQRIILVTSAFHMKRAKRIFERKGLNVIPYPVDFRAKKNWVRNALTDPMHWIPKAENLSSSSIALRELLGRLVYRTW